VTRCTTSARSTHRVDPCGIPSIHCVAMARSRGEPCRRYAVPGTTICHFHGENAGRVQRAAPRGASWPPSWPTVGDWSGMCCSIASTNADLIARENRNQNKSGVPDIRLPPWVSITADWRTGTGPTTRLMRRRPKVVMSRDKHQHHVAEGMYPHAGEQ
jgi:hypothetical protein